MADSDNALLLKMNANIRSLEQAMDRASGKVDKTARAMERRAAKAAQEMDRAFGNGFRMAENGARIAFAGISAYAIKVASDASELESAFEVAFKTGADEANTFARALADKVGRAAIDVKGQMTDLQLVLSGLGLEAEQSMEIVRRLTERSIDIGSLFNVSDADAMRAIISGISGETEPLKRFGVVLSETAVKAELLRLGFKGNAADASEAAKAIARTNLIMQKSSVAHGDAARTADSLANKTKRMQGQFKEAAIELGNQLLPAITATTTVTTQAIKAFTDLPAGVQLASLSLLALVAAGGPIMGAIKGLRELIVWAGSARVALGLIGASTATGGGKGGKSFSKGAAGGAVAGGALAGGAAGAYGVASAVAVYQSFEDKAAQDRYDSILRTTKSKGLRSASEDDLEFARQMAQHRLKNVNSETPFGPTFGEGFRSEQSAIYNRDLKWIEAEEARRAKAQEATVKAEVDRQMSEVLEALQLSGTQLQPVSGGNGTAPIRKSGSAAQRDERFSTTDNGWAKYDFNQFGPLSDPEKLEAVRLNVEALDDAFADAEVPQIISEWDRAASTFGDILEYSLGRGEDALDSFRRALADVAMQWAASGLADIMFGERDERSGIRRGGWLDGKRANGGPVAGGKTYLVGERGPELFTPNGSGDIVPNHALRNMRLPSADRFARQPQSMNFTLRSTYQIEGAVGREEIANGLRLAHRMAVRDAQKMIRSQAPKAVAYKMRYG